ncbi:pilus assembly protein N-terminal domain-containing protein [Thiomicrorhabdus sp. HH1]|uniref:Pilus assembly protein N-terminal domain-containing protein n=2 Tax=Piscirickettsiaceae TaxID=135616 RepID=A0ABS0BZZ8_9GAMM|nr:pilus assembly protein N-terminal domain-containing protein [Thiomicrorhabdus heinhorstiae]
MQNKQFSPFILVIGFLVVGLLSSFTVKAEVAPIYSVKEGESQIIKINFRFNRAMIANPNVATLKVLNKSELLLTGKSAGSTQLMLTPKSGAKAQLFAVKVMADQTQRLQIEETLDNLLKDLNPQGTVTYKLKRIWVKSGSSVRREVDNVGNQVDGDASEQVLGRQDSEVLQTETTSGSVNIQPLAGDYMVILKGDVPNKAQKKRIQSVISALGLSVVNMVHISGPQRVKLSVRIAEVVKGNPFRSGFILRDSNQRIGVSAPGTASSLLGVLSNALENIVPAQNDAFQIGFNPAGEDLFGLLSIMEGNQLARVLAKPELIVQAGETAEFLVGGEVPIPVAQNAEAITVKYKEFGVRLRFSPVITDSGEIQMTVAPEVSNIDETAGQSSGSITVPGFRSRRASTTITLAAGQSFVIGGLLQDNFSSSVSKIPFLGDIPIIGALFRSTTYEKDQSELAILVTPTFVDPIEKGTKIRLPGENMDRPTAAEGFFEGKVVEMLPEGQVVLPELSDKIGLEKP